MENASKAIMIAGTVLVVIIIISIGVLLAKTLKDKTNTDITAIESQKISTFNSQFLAFEGDRKGSTIRELIERVNKNNKIDNIHKVVVMSNESSIQDSNTYNVTLYYSNGQTLIAPGVGIELCGKYDNTCISEKGYINLIVVKTK